MLQVESDKRISAKDALSNPWIKSLTTYPTVSKKQASDALQNIKALAFSQQIQKAVIIYMTKIFLDRSEKEMLHALFELMDTDRDSQIDVSDIGRAYRDMFDYTIQDSELVKIGKQVDVSREGGITITEFVLAACNKQTLITENNVKYMFSYIDQAYGGNGFICRDELKAFLGVNDDNYVRLIIEEADDDGDGGLTLKEFSTTIMRIQRLGAQ